MGKPNIRLNPKVDSIRNRVLLKKALNLLLCCAMLLPPLSKKRRGRPPFDYRIVLVLSILRVLLRKRYSDYETEMRTDKRLMETFGMDQLPCKSTLNNYDLNVFTIKFLSKFNKKLIDAWIKKPVDLLLDASGIRIIGKSIWFCIRTKQRIKRRECDKVHLAVSMWNLLIVNFRITKSRKNDSPLLRILLKPFSVLGLIIADLGYSNKTNTLFVANKKGAFFCPFKSNVNPSGFNAWAYIYRLWNVFGLLCKRIYNKRSKVEAVFSVLKRRYGDQLYAKLWYSRRREMIMRFIAYNVRIIVAIQLARNLNVPLWIRAEKL